MKQKNHKTRRIFDHNTTYWSPSVHLAFKTSSPGHASACTSSVNRRRACCKVWMAKKFPVGDGQIVQLRTTNAKSGWGKNRSAVIHEHRKPIGHHTSKILEGKRIHSGSLHIRSVLLQRFHFDPFCFFVRCSSEAVRKAVRDITKTSGKRATTWCMNFGISDAPVKLDATFAYHSFNISYYHPGFHKMSNYRLLK